MLWKQQPVYDKSLKMQNCEEISRKKNLIFHFLWHFNKFFNKSLWSDSNDFAKVLQDRLDISLVNDVTLEIIWVINVYIVYVISFILKCNVC